MKYKHDVFISFRGTDVRHGLLGYLKKDLHRQKIDFYVDDVKLERGGEISSSLLIAIQESQILLVIFSKDYASSRWWLMELEKIMECAEKNKQVAVVPVFYKLDPEDVRHQKGDYGAAFVKHETREDLVKVQKWRSALNKATQLSGFHYPLDSELDESDFLDGIVEDISTTLRKFSSSESDDPTILNDLVGIDKHIGWITSVMTNNSDEVIKIGIWGMGGIGKTTIAQLVFDKFSHQYEGCYFLDNIRDELKISHLNYLRDEVVSKLLGEENPHITGASKANSSTMRRLSMKKVLIVLDNVNTPMLLKDFLEPIRFGAGSRVIVTSRYKQVFTSGVFDEIHHVKELEFEESLELFCLNAFNEIQPKMGFEELSVEAVAIAKGVPLALKVFGSYFHSKSEGIWKCALKRFNKYPDHDGEIQSVLRFSYDELDDTNKKIFLDIAFFFKEEDKDYVISELDAWNFHGTSGIPSLQEKALITISKDNKIQMHDLIQKMGWEIVRQESTTPGRRSRLNDPVEVNDILNNGKGSDSVEGILLDVSQIGEVALNNADSLKKMPKLRLIKVYSPLSAEVPRQTRIPEPEMNEYPTKSKEIFTQQPCDDMDFFHNILLGKETQIEKMLSTFIEMNILEMPKLNLPMHMEHAMPDLPIIQDSKNNTKGSMLDISNQLGMTKLSKWAVFNEFKLENLYTYYKRKEVLLLSATNDLSRLMPQQNSNIRSAALKKLKSLGSDIHVKFIHHRFMKSCSTIPNALSLSTKEIRSINSTLAGMELLNSSTVPLLDQDDEELPFVRSTHYYRLSISRENKDSRKPKPLILFDGLRCSEQMSISFVDDDYVSCLQVQVFVMQKLLKLLSG